MSTLVGRSLCKDMANIPRHDAQYDSLLDAIRERISRDVEGITGRQFDKRSRTEFHQSHLQMYGDPTPQWVFVSSPPIDVAVVPVLDWAPYDDHDEVGYVLELNSDWKYETSEVSESGAAAGDVVGLRIQRFSSVPNTNLPLPAAFTAVLGTSPTGFRVVYTGGYTVSAIPGAPPAGKARDPFADGEGDVVAAPAGLQGIVAAKVAENLDHLLGGTRHIESSGQTTRGAAEALRTFLLSGIVLPWTPEQKKNLTPYMRMDRTWL